MLRARDRLYESLDLPDLAWELATTCPVLLRLREIRMANIPFLTHPSFANVDRYEHSLGVAHLAWRWATRSRLPADDGLALTIAALYHDGATPAFGHLLEEYLRRYDFDHEATLVDLLQGTCQDLPGAEHLQVFLGRHCKLTSALPRPKDSTSALSPFAVADIAAGRGALGRLIKADVDLDNIDNVIRAASAMGVIPPSVRVHPYDIVDALIMEDGDIRIDRTKGFAIATWLELRKILYDTILNNAYEFRAQTTMKWAIEECASSEPTLRRRAAWILTDPELVFEHLRNVQFSRLLVDRLRIGAPPELLFSAWFEDISPLIGDPSGTTSRSLCRDLSDLTNTEVYVNYYSDKRVRNIVTDLATGTSLFPTISSANLASPSQAAGRAGIVGAIYLSRSEKMAAMENSAAPGPLGRRTVELPELSSVLRRYFGAPPVALSTNWVGTSPRPTRPQLLFVND